MLDGQQSLSKRIDAAMLECSAILDCAPLSVDRKMIDMFNKLRECQEVLVKYQLQGPMKADA